MTLNRKSDGTSRLECPPGARRRDRPWDRFHEDALLFVVANPDLERYKIARVLGIAPSVLSQITCSPSGLAFLAEVTRNPPHDLCNYRLPVDLYLE
jgi:hypothetical protein